MKLFWKLKKYNISLLLCFTVFFLFFTRHKSRTRMADERGIEMFFIKIKTEYFLCLYSNNSKL